MSGDSQPRIHPLPAEEQDEQARKLLAGVRVRDAPAANIFATLVRHPGLFRRWLPLARRHGWLVIEAHAVPAATLAGLIGRTHATVLDATHGYACQYPVEPAVFAWAARAGGFVSRGHAEPGAATLGHTILTIDHVVADQTAASQVL